MTRLIRFLVSGWGDNTLLLFTVAMDKARRLRRQYGEDWDQLAPEGPTVAEILVFVSWWWYVHPARIGRIGRYHTQQK